MSIFLSSSLKLQAMLAAGVLAVTLGFNLEHADSGDDVPPAELVQFLSLPCGDAVIGCSEPR